MNLNLKSIVVLALVALSSFPVVILCVLLLTGNARIEFGARAKKTLAANQVEVFPHSAGVDSLNALNSKTFQALEQEKNDIAAEKRQLAEKQQGLDLFRQDLDARKADLEQKRAALASLVIKEDSVAGKKMRQLSKVYASMKPAEAAQIIGTLPDQTASSLLNGINDDRQKAKIFAALPPDKASELTRFMAGNPRAGSDSSAP
jgi:flagellar motility protein MotE (MotC chaperone)